MDNLLPLGLPSALALAYIGDARHSLYIRRMLVKRGITKPGELNEQSLKYVTCEAQAAAYLKIESLLTEGERAVFKYASNSTHLNKPKRAKGRDYRLASGFEAVIGMLDYTDCEDRLMQLLDAAYSENQAHQTQTEDIQ